MRRIPEGVIAWFSTVADDLPNPAHYQAKVLSGTKRSRRAVKWRVPRIFLILLLLVPISGSFPVYAALLTGDAANDADYGRPRSHEADLLE